MTNENLPRSTGETVAGDIALPEALWVVIAAYNEAPRITKVLDDLLRVVPKVVVVDDGSTDDTRSSALTRPVWVITHPVNLGQGAALQTGIAFALRSGASHVLTFDADGQHSTDDIPRLIAALEEFDAEFALGSRFLGAAEGIPLARKVLLRLAILFTRVVSGVTLSDAHNGLRAMTRRGAEQIRLTFNRMEHASEIIEQVSRSGLRYVEVPVTIRYTDASLAKGQRTTAAFGLALRFLLERFSR